METESSVLYVVVAVYFVLNLLSLFGYMFDKRAAVRGGRRTSEKTLLLMSLIGPFGAVLGMRLFHHKTRKAKFLLVPVFALAHLVFWMYVLFDSGLRNLLF